MFIVCVITLFIWWCCELLRCSNRWMVCECEVLPQIPCGMAWYIIQASTVSFWQLTAGTVVSVSWGYNQQLTKQLDSSCSACKFFVTIPCIFIQLIYHSNMHLIKYNSWQVLNSCMFCHWGAILREFLEQRNTNPTC